MQIPAPPIELHRIAGQFQLNGRCRHAGPFGNGHLNETYLVVCENGTEERHYVLQRLNPIAFNEPLKLMDNVARVLNHQAGKPEALADHRRSLTLVLARSNAPCLFDDENHCWRCYHYIPGSISYDTAETPEQAYQAARAFGSFLTELQDLPGPELHETIPEFHHTPKRFRRFQDVLALDPHNRAGEVADLVDFYLARAELTSQLTDQIANGDLPLRPTHNDTKVNNVLLDHLTGEALCVVDLDTVMPGIAAYDFGDLVRSCTSTVAEDHPEPAEVACRIEVFRALAKGFLETAGDSLSKAERDSLVLGGKLMTFEVGMRFLTDYLEGDVYFRIHRPKQNLDRARTHAVLLADLERHEELLHAIIRDAARHS